MPSSSSTLPIVRMKSFSEMPLVQWLLFAVIFALLYVVVLMRMDASRARVLEYRQTTRTYAVPVAKASSESSKPSPFGERVRNGNAQNAVSESGAHRTSAVAAGLDTVAMAIARR